MTNLHVIMTEAAEHLTVFELEEPASVQVRTYDSAVIVVQLRACHLPEVAAGLLTWADTLTPVSACAWRPEAGTSVHLQVTGRISAGHQVKVFGAVPHSAVVFGDLQPGGQTSVSLGVLREWATLGEVAA